MQLIIPMTRTYVSSLLLIKACFHRELLLTLYFYKLIIITASFSSVIIYYFHFLFSLRVSTNQNNLFRRNDLCDFKIWTIHHSSLHVTSINYSSLSLSLLFFTSRYLKCAAYTHRSFSFPMCLALFVGYSLLLYNYLTV